MSQFAARDYIWLASHMRRELELAREQDGRGIMPYSVNSIVEGIIRRLADALAKDNPLGFDPDLFLHNAIHIRLGPAHSVPADRRADNP